jgi:hypothetical protein
LLSRYSSRKAKVQNIGTIFEVTVHITAAVTVVGQNFNPDEEQQIIQDPERDVFCSAMCLFLQSKMQHDCKTF